MPLPVPILVGSSGEGRGGAQGVGQAWVWPRGWWTQHVHPDGVSDLDCESEPHRDGEGHPGDETGPDLCFSLSHYDNHQPREVHKHPGVSHDPASAHLEHRVWAGGP